MECKYCKSDNLIKTGYTFITDLYLQYFSCPDCGTNITLSQKLNPTERLKQIKYVYQKGGANEET